MDYIKGKCTRDSCRYFHPPPHLQAQIKALQQRANAAAAAQAQALVGYLTTLSCHYPNHPASLTSPLLFTLSDEFLYTPTALFC